jgi:DNA-binding NtrC family response regulator
MGGASQTRAVGELTTTSGRLLVVDDGSFAASDTLQELEPRARRIVHAATGEQALELATHGGLDLILVSSSVGGMSGIEFVRQARATGVETGMLLVLDEEDREVLQEAHDLGIVMYLPSSATPEQIVATTALALGHQTMLRENRDMRRRLGLLESGEAVIGCSIANRRLLGVLARVAESSATVLIEGKTGSGKSLAARVIHMSGRRSERAHVVEPCANLSGEQLEESLTAAHGGTITLDDVDQLPAPTQSCLVRYLKERAPSGAMGRQGLDVRIIATTAAHLPELVARGQFREDLYYRLNVFPIVIPSLQERRDDIPLLAKHFLEQSAEQTGLANKGFTTAAMILMEAHPWPQNVAQLQNAIFRAHALANGMPIDRDHLLGPATGLQIDHVPKNIFESPDVDAEDAPVREEDILPMETEEKRLLARALKATRGNVRRAAQLLRIGRATLYRKIQVYKLRLN